MVCRCVVLLEKPRLIKRLSKTIFCLLSVVATLKTWWMGFPNRNLRELNGSFSSLYITLLISNNRER